MRYEERKRELDWVSSEWYTISWDVLLLFSKAPRKLSSEVCPLAFISLCLLLFNVTVMSVRVAWCHWGCITSYMTEITEVDIFGERLHKYLNYVYLIINNDQNPTGG